MDLMTAELVAITKNKNKLISYGFFFDSKLVYSVAWIYKYYFNESILVFLPRQVNKNESLESFNNLVGEFVLTDDEVCYCSLETIEAKRNSKVIIYGFADFIFNELNILNRRRMLTYLKNLKCKKLD